MRRIRSNKPMLEFHVRKTDEDTSIWSCQSGSSCKLGTQFTDFVIVGINENQNQAGLAGELCGSLNLSFEFSGPYKR